LRNAKDLEDLLHDWATWVLSNHGYPSKSPICGFKEGGRSTKAHTHIPGKLPSKRIMEIDRAIRVMGDESKPCQMAIIIRYGQKEDGSTRNIWEQYQAWLHCTKRRPRTYHKRLKEAHECLIKML
jgi:hypothetical protein